MRQMIKTQLDTQTDLDKAMATLLIQAPELKAIHAQCAAINLRRRPAGLKGLLQIIIAQQVSVASANAIWEKFNKEFPDMTPKILANASLEELQACGLSRPKIKTVQCLGHAMLDGFDFTLLETLPDKEAKKALVSLHGIGPWTADIYLLFGLGRADIFPAGDLALQIAVEKALGLNIRPKSKELEAKAADRWSPCRGAAAHLFWAYYRILKVGKEGVA